MARAGLSDLLRRIEALERQAKRGPNLDALNPEQRARYDRDIEYRRALTYEQYLERVETDEYLRFDNDIHDVLYGANTRLLSADSPQQIYRKYIRRLEGM